MAIYSLAVDTILACFIVDEMNQAAKGGKAALYGPSELNALLPQDDWHTTTQTILKMIIHLLYQITILINSKININIKYH